MRLRRKPPAEVHILTLASGLQVIPLDRGDSIYVTRERVRFSWCDTDLTTASEAGDLAAKYGMTSVDFATSKLPPDVYQFLFALAFTDTGADARTRRGAWATLIRHSEAQLRDPRPEDFTS